MSNWVYPGGNTALALPYTRSFNGASATTWMEITASAASDYCAVEVYAWGASAGRWKLGIGAPGSEADITPLIQGTGSRMALVRVPVAIRRGARVALWMEAGAQYVACNLVTGASAMDAGYATATPLNATPVNATTSWVQVSASTSVAALGLLLIYADMAPGVAGDIGVGASGSQVVIGSFYNGYNGTFSAWLGQPVPAGTNLWVRLDGGTCTFTACALT